MQGFNRNVDVLVPQVLGAFASGVLTSNNTNVSNNDTVTIGTQVYTFKTALTDGSTHPNEVLISVTNADGSLTNLASAINGTGTPGTDYDSSTPLNANVSSSAVASHALTMTAKTIGNAANSVATTKSAVTLSWGDTSLDGGQGGQMTAYLMDTTTITTLAMDVESYYEAILFVKIAAHAGTNPTLDAKVQYGILNADNSYSWVDSGDTLTQITTVDALTFKKLTLNFGKWVRLVFTLGGTTPSYTADIKLLGKL